MAISFDSASDVTGSTGTTVTWAHNCVGTNRLLLVGFRNTNGDNVTGVTYNGVAMTLQRKFNLGGSDWDYFYYLINPSSSTNNVSVSYSVSSGGTFGHSVSYAGVNQVSFPDASQNGNGTASSFTGTVTTVADNCWTVIFGDNESGTLTAGAGTTLRTTFGSHVIAFADSNGPITPPTSSSLTLNLPGSDLYMYTIVSIAPPASAVAATGAFLLNFV